MLATLLSKLDIYQSKHMHMPVPGKFRVFRRPSCHLYWNLDRAIRMAIQSEIHPDILTWHMVNCYSAQYYCTLSEIIQGRQNCAISNTQDSAGATAACNFSKKQWGLQAEM